MAGGPLKVIFLCVCLKWLHSCTCNCKITLLVGLATTHAFPVIRILYRGMMVSTCRCFLKSPGARGSLAPHIRASLLKWAGLAFVDLRFWSKNIVQGSPLLSSGNCFKAYTVSGKQRHLCRELSSSSLCPWLPRWPIPVVPHKAGVRSPGSTTFRNGKD